jgi:hypothetical protein
MSGNEKTKFKVGQKVWLKNNHEIAVVSKIDYKGIMYVDIDGIIIPVFMNDVSTEIPSENLLNKKPNTKSLERELKKAEPKWQFIQNESISNGLAILFIPNRLKDGEIISFDCVLLNTTDEIIKINFSLLDNYETVIEVSEIITSKSVLELTHFDSALINDIHSFYIEIIPNNKEFIPVSFTQKISSTSFIKKLKLIQSINHEAFYYHLLDSFKKVAIKEKAKDYDYFNENTEEIKIDTQLLRKMMLDSAIKKDAEVVVPIKEIDLHLEAITNKTDGLTNTDILLLQIEHFGKNLDRAIRSGQKVFYAIHGNGKGKLKKEIENILKTHSEVKSFNNNYNPQYGFGATEIHLR